MYQVIPETRNLSIVAIDINESQLDVKRDYLIIECMFVAWAEATKQSDIKNSLK